MVYPWMLQEMMGMSREENNPAQRAETLTAATPATFGDLNWGHCENGTAHPEASAGVSILMGPAIKAEAGDGSRRSVGSTVIMYTSKMLRQDGWCIQIIPDGYKEEIEEGERPAKKKKEEKDPETRYLESDSYDFSGLEIKDKNGAVVGRLNHLSVDRPWLCLVSMSPKLTDSAKQKLKTSFALSELKSEEFSLEYSRPGYSVAGVTGVAAGSTNPSTLFTLKFGEKTVGKALCTYENGEMSSVGPTLELLEIAREWRRHGLGEELMEVVETYFEGLFLPAIEHKGSVLFSVCYVTSGYASRWFQNHLFFSDLDGIGEELGKRLVLDEDVYSEY